MAGRTLIQALSPQGSRHRALTQETPRLEVLALPRGPHAALVVVAKHTDGQVRGEIVDAEAVDVLAFTSE